MATDYAVPTGGEELDFYLAGLDDEEIVTLKLDLQEELGEITAQIKAAAAKAAATGEYSDSDWYRRAHGAKRVKANQYNAACAEQGRRKRERRAVAEQEARTFCRPGEVDPYPRAFMEAARQVLSGDVHQAVHARAVVLVGAAGAQS